MHLRGVINIFVDGLLGILNSALFPLIFLWQILYSFFRYAELVKRQPAFLGSRRWSNYGRHYFRHFNELDHDFNARLNRGYKAADMYLSLFMSPLMTILAKNIAFLLAPYWPCWLC